MMEQEKVLSLILSKLDNIEKEQQEMKADIKGIDKELKTIKQDIKEIKSIQGTIQEFMLSTETAIEKYEQDHRFIEKLKKVAGE